MSAEELSDGIRLACHTTVEGSCRIDFLNTEPTENKILTDANGTLSAHEPAFCRLGAAIDIGTTTLAAKLFDTEGTLLAECARMNPQSIWGADVISRIEASIRGEIQPLAQCIRQAIDEMLAELSTLANVKATDVDGVVLTGNTAMLHMLTATDVEPLSHAPFEARRLFGETTYAADMGLTSIDPHAEIYLPNCISAFVGADMVCALLATKICDSAETALLADIGTNGEMGLWHNGRLAVCSTAAGPAFEGVGISMGMSGATGAIDRVTLQNGTLCAHVIGNVAPKGICGSGLVDAICCLLESEDLDETGYLEDDPATVCAPVVLTQQDIRMVQLAKSAICAGLCTLLRDANVNAESAVALYVAGGFGSYLNMQSAGRIGLIPPTLAGKVKVSGNAALSGAAMLLLDKSCRAQAAHIAKSAGVLDLASNPVFADLYMQGMMFE